MRKWLLRIKAYFVGGELVEVRQVDLFAVGAGSEVAETGQAIGSDHCPDAKLEILQEDCPVVPGLFDPVTGVRLDPTLGWLIEERGTAQ